jgi:prolipoprotein diacylglyceryltransferase
MLACIFLLIFGLCCFAYLYWGNRALPKEHWQFMATLPKRRKGEGPWEGINLTWYGFFSANAYLVAVALFLLLTGTLALPRPAMAVYCLAVLCICVPASKLVARIVEKKAHTFTVGGAVFVGLVCAPWIMLLFNSIARMFGGEQLPVLPVLSALATAYAFGEGLGRMACISFGCCYGKPLEESPDWLTRFFSKKAVCFCGETKKIAYASDLENKPVLPIQTTTAALYIITGLISCALFLRGFYFFAFGLTVTITQLWRVVSEFMRADYRGGGRLSAYQWMGLAAIPYAWSLFLFFQSDTAALPVLELGLSSLWNPGLVLGLQALWLFILFFTGRSAVTGATLTFHVHHEKI